MYTIVIIMYLIFNVVQYVLLHIACILTSIHLSNLCSKKPIGCVKVKIKLIKSDCGVLLRFPGRSNITEKLEVCDPNSYADH